MVMTYAPILDMLGGVVCGSVLSSATFGIITIQTWYYHKNFPNDSRTTKITVVLLWSLQGFQVFCSARTVHWYLVSHFGDPSAFGSSLWEAHVSIASNVFSSSSLQAYMSWRIYQLSRSRILAMVNAVFVISALICGIVLFVSVPWHGGYIWARTPVWTILTWVVVCALLDAMLAVAMSFLLWKRRTGALQTDKAIMHMVKYVANSGVLTSAVSILLVGVVLASAPVPTAAIGVCYGNLYTIAMLSILHSRAPLQHASRAANLQLHTLGGDRREPVVITITKETQRASFHDGEPEIAVRSRIESRYPFIESRTYSNLKIKSESQDIDVNGVDDVHEKFEDTMITDVLALHETR